MRPILHLARKDLLQLRRDRLGLFWILGWPLVFALFFGALFGGGGGEAGELDVAIVDADGSDASTSYERALDASEGLALTHYESIESARDAVRTGKRTAYVLLKDGFGEGLGPLFEGGDALEVGVDPARRAESGFLQGMLMEAAFRSTVERFRDPSPWREEVQRQLGRLRVSEALGATQRGVLVDFLESTDTFLADFDADTLDVDDLVDGAGFEVVEVVATVDGPSSAWQIMFPSATLWGVIAVTSALAITLVKERQKGTWQRLLISPLSEGGILAGKGIACFAACCFVQVVLLGFGRIALDVDIVRPLSLAAAIPSVALAFSGLMVLLSTLGRTEQAVAGAAWGVLLVCAMLGGGMIPLFFMPEWMRTASLASPVRWGIVALEGAIWRDFGLVAMARSCGVLVAIGLAAAFVGQRVLRARSD